MKNKKIKIIIGIICLLIVIIIGAIGLYNKENKSSDRKWEIKEKYYDSGNLDLVSQIATVQHWEELTTTQKYNKALYEDITYYNAETQITENKIEKSLCKSTLNGKDSYTEEEHSINAKIYKILNTSTKCAIALQFENESSYNIYINSNYKPETLGQFIKDLDLKNTLSFSKEVTYEPIKDGKREKEIEFEGVDSNIIWEMLFSDTTVQNVHKDTEYHQEILSIKIKNPLSQFDRYSVTMSEDGYLHTNILETGKTFYIGQEKVKEFLNYLMDNCKGYEIVYVDTNQNVNAEKNEDEKIMKYDITTNTITEVDMNEIRSKNNSIVSSENYLEPYNPND